MRAKRLRSTLIDRIVFDDDRGTLAVSFRDARRYIYEGVPRAVYDAFGRAESAGRFFNECVKGRFTGHPDPALKRYRPLAKAIHQAIALPERIGKSGTGRHGG